MRGDSACEISSRLEVAIVLEMKYDVLPSAQVSRRMEPAEFRPSITFKASSAGMSNSA